MRKLVIGLALAAFSWSIAAAQDSPPPPPPPPVDDSAVAQPPILSFGESELVNIPIGYECPPDFAGYLPPSVEIGMVGAQISLMSLPNNLRALPDVRGAILGTAAPGSVIDRIISGPACSAAYVWWLVDVGGAIGWTPESDQSQSAYWIDPVFVVGGDEIPPPPPPVEATDEVPPPPPPAEATDEVPPPPPPANTVVSNPGIRIDYGRFGVTLINVTDERIPLGQLSFSSETGSFNGSEWGFNTLPGGDCVQLYYSSASRPNVPTDCGKAQSWIARGTPNILFWQSEFTISLNGAPVGVCEAGPNNATDVLSCEVALG